MGGLESDNQCGFEDGVIVLAFEEEAVYLLVEEVGEVAGFDAHGESHAEGRGLIVERDCEGAGRGCDGGSSGVQFLEVFFIPWVAVRAAF